MLPSTPACLAVSLWLVSLLTSLGCSDDGASTRDVGDAGRAGASAGASGQQASGAGGADQGAGGQGASAGTAGQGAAGSAGGAAGGSGGTGSTTPDWASVYALSLHVCVNCHSGDPEQGIRPDLSSEEEGYTTVTTKMASYCFLTGEQGVTGAMPYVTPGDPSRSALYQVVTEGMGCNASLMPKNMPPLSSDQIGRLQDWITAGAPR